MPKKHLLAISLFLPLVAKQWLSRARRSRTIDVGLVKSRRELKSQPLICNAIIILHWPMTCQRHVRNPRLARMRSDLHDGIVRVTRNPVDASGAAVRKCTGERKEA